MPLMDHISDLAQKFGPSKSFKSGGIGSGHGMVAPEDDVCFSSPIIRTLLTSSCAAHRLKTNNRLPLWPDILQLSCDVLLC